MIRNVVNGQPNMTVWPVVDVRLDPVHQPSVCTFETRPAHKWQLKMHAVLEGKWGCEVVWVNLWRNTMNMNCAEFLGHPHIRRPMQEVRGRRKMVSLCSLITLADIGSFHGSGVFFWFLRAKITRRTTSLLPLHHHRGTKRFSLYHWFDIWQLLHGTYWTYFIFQSSSGSSGSLQRE